MKHNHKTGKWTGSHRRRLCLRLEAAGTPKHLIYDVEDLGNRYGALARARFETLDQEQDGTDY